MIVECRGDSESDWESFMTSVTPSMTPGKTQRNHWPYFQAALLVLRENSF